MDPVKIRHHGESGPEAKIQAAIRRMLLERGWFVVRMPGNALISGMPDLFCTHSRVHGHIRLVEVKLPEMKGSKFTPAQLDMFPKLCANGAGVWILTAANDIEYNKLFEPPNWRHYLH